MRMTRWSMATAAVLAIAACSSGADAVDATLSEWAVAPSPSTIDAGTVTINAINDGGETHELVVVRADSADDLPVDADGKVIEDELPEGDFIGEISEFDAGTTESASFDLEAGTYVLFCNILEEDEGVKESHFQEGMHALLTVEG